MAFLITTTPAFGVLPGSFGAPFPFLGRSVMVEFDLFCYAQMQDSDKNHVGVTTFRQDMLPMHFATGTPNFVLSGGDRIYVWVDYDGPWKVMKVYAITVLQ